ncbi:MAG TPA: S-layer homology domain-containing protein [Anaerovoracaceae bacterium]|nr:S-layer homology domain-containing protein [Anaerovoracaceae bacterium]
MKNSKRVIALILTVILTIASASSVVFADIDYSQWNSQANYPSDVVGTPLFTSVKYLIDKKILTGYSDGTFKPANSITRAEIAVAVAKATNRTANLDAMAQKDVFKDLSGYDWAKGYINALVDAGMIKGVSATTYAPGKNISYAELITILARMNSGAASTVESSGTWPTNYIQYVQMYNYLGDVTVTDWNAPATRGDTAKLLYRFLPKKASSTTTSAISVDLKI